MVIRCGLHLVKSDDVPLECSVSLIFFVIKVLKNMVAITVRSRFVNLFCGKEAFTVRWGEEVYNIV